MGAFFLNKILISFEKLKFVKFYPKFEIRLFLLLNRKITKKNTKKSNLIVFFYNLPQNMECNIPRLLQVLEIEIIYYDFYRNNLKTHYRDFWYV